VLLDIAMPVRDGTSTFEELRRIDPGARVLMFSGFSEESSAGALIEAGAVGFVQKPFSAQVLSDAVTGALGAAADDGPAKEPAQS